MATKYVVLPCGSSSAPTAEYRAGFRWVVRRVHAESLQPVSAETHGHFYEQAQARMVADSLTRTHFLQATRERSMDALRA